MDNKLPFIDVLGRTSGSRRKEDPNSFEYTYLAEITNAYPLTRNEKLYQIQIIDPELRDSFSFRPGQFVMLELPGIGEAPFSISSSPNLCFFLMISEPSDIRILLQPGDRSRGLGR